MILENKKIVILLSFLFSFSLFADDFDEDEKNYEISGNLKSFNYIYHYFSDIPFSTLKKGTPYGSNSTKVNIKLDYFPSDIFKTSISYHIGTLTQNRSIAAFNSFITPSSGYRVIDLPKNINLDNSETLFPQNLNRAYIKIIYSFLELTIGRDAISKGSAKAINPTDLFSPFSIQNLDTEEKIGIDLVRARFNLGDFSAIDTAYIMGKDFEFKESAFLLSYSTKIKEATIELSSLYFYENLLIGFDFNKDIKGALFWIESAFVIPKVTEKTEEKRYLRVTTGFNYMLSNNTYLSLEYHYNEAGISKTDDIFSLLTKEAYIHGGVYLQGKHYLIPSISYPITPLLNSIFSAMINLTDPSVLGIFKLEYNIQENVYIDLNLFLRAGKTLSSKTLLPDSEFGSYPNIYNLSLRIYF